MRPSYRYAPDTQEALEALEAVEAFDLEEMLEAIERSEIDRLLDAELALVETAPVPAAWIAKRRVA